jgi:hypothetical protein
MSIAAVRDAADTVTVLRAKGGMRLTKQWTRFEGMLQETSYARARRFSVTEHPVSNIRELGEFIRQISADPQAAVVRGAIASGVNRNDMLRRARPRGDAPATLMPKPRWWLGLDLEKIPCPPGIDLLFEPDATVEHAISLLPPRFHDVTCLWQFTAGHGIKHGIRLRLWYWLNRLTSDEELRRWLGERVRQDGVSPSQWPQRWPIDPVLFNPIQLHYTAAPIFDGLSDPVPLRCGWCRGLEDVVVVPDLVLARERICRPSTSVGPTAPGLGYEGWRARIGDHEGGDGFFKPIKSAIGAYFAVNRSGASAEWLIWDLAAVIRERQGDRSDLYIEERLRDLPNAVAAIRVMQASREEEATEQARQILHFESDTRGPLLIAERREDAEAGWHATGLEAWACLAGLPKTLGDSIPIDRMVVVLIADLGRFSLARRAVRKTIRQWQRERRKVVQAAPRPLLKGNGSTFADLLKEAGPEAVKARIEAALTPRTLPERMSVEQARQLLGERIKLAVEELVSWTPPAA